MLLSLLIFSFQIMIAWNLLSRIPCSASVSVSVPISVSVIPFPFPHSGFHVLVLRVYACIRRENFGIHL